jgi:hypothetical protein
MKIHTLEETISCKSGDYDRKFRDIGSANFRYKNACGGKLVCEELDCGIVFSSKYSLERHVGTYHGDPKISMQVAWLRSRVYFSDRSPETLGNLYRQPIQASV